MVTVKPFKGLRYTQQQSDTMRQLVAPPYDVISPKEQDGFYDSNPHNVIRLILGKHQPDDSDTSNVYTRAADTLTEWLSSGIVAHDNQPAFYGYQQTWQGVTRGGFIGLLQCEPFEEGHVIPHEWTLGGPKADRLALMKATGSVLSPIFCLYDDRDRTIDVTCPANCIDITDWDGVRHQFWSITDPNTIAAIEATMASQNVLIADGHHRYETAVTYRNWRRTQDSESSPYGQRPYDFTMAFFTNMADPGLKVYPTHRILTALPNGMTQAILLEQLNTVFEPCADPAALFWVQTPQSDKQGYQLKANTDLSCVPDVMHTLDVALLDALVFQGILGHSANDLKSQGCLQFIRNEDDIAQLLQNEPNTLVFWVHAPSIRDIRTICTSGERMPQKSTYFFPKLLSGLVFHHYGTQPITQPTDASMALNA